MNVLVTGLFEPAALHAIRRLGQLGHTVYTAEGHRLAYAAFSRHVHKRIRLPNMRQRPVEYAEALLAELESGRFDLYFPCYEEIILMSRYRDRIRAAVRTVMSGAHTLMQLHDKANLASLAAELGIDTPSIYAPRSVEDARQHMATLEVPVVIKMRRSSGAAGFRIVRDHDDLDRMYTELVEINNLPDDDLPLIQQYIEGPVNCTLALCTKGEVLGDVMYRGRRTFPRIGGTCTVRETADDTACSQAAARLLKHLSFDGFCGFDFIIDEVTGRPFVIDGNCRTTPAVTLAYHGGSDMIAAWLGVAQDTAVSLLPRVPTQVRTRLHFADFVWLLQSYVGSLKDWSGEREQRRERRREKGFFYDIRSGVDPMPGVMVWVYILTNLYKLVFTRLDASQLFIQHNQYAGE